MLEKGLVFLARQYMLQVMRAVCRGVCNILILSLHPIYKML